MTAPHEPTEKNRKTVEAMSSYGIPQEDIAKVIGVDAKTLRKCYRDELDTATAKANAMVAGKLFNNCMSGKEASIFFWLKTRGGYREVERKETQFLDKNGNPTDFADQEKQITKNILKLLPSDQLNAILIAESNDKYSRNND